MVPVADVAGSDFLAGLEWFFFALILMIAVFSWLFLSSVFWVVFWISDRNERGPTREVASEQEGER